MPGINSIFNMLDKVKDEDLSEQEKSIVDDLQTFMEELNNTDSDGTSSSEMMDRIMEIKNKAEEAAKKYKED